jgi:hypothetical protein
MIEKGMQLVDADGDRVLLPFDKVLKMSKGHEAGTLWIKLFDPMGVNIKIENKEEAARVWSAFQGWLMGFPNP